MNTGKDHLGGCILSGDSATYVTVVWDKLIELFNIKSMLDVGCGCGYSTKYFIDKGVESLGVEGYIPAITNSLVKDNLEIHDYTLGVFVPLKRYDLAWCCEFVEHVEEKYVDNFMKTFDMCDVVAMTHGVPDQPGYHHVNCQEAEYWIKKLEEYDFEYLEDISFMLRDSLLTYTIETPQNLQFGGHVKNTLMIFKKK